jgi:diguanylate cyclase (GGDEF)-like protein
MLVGLDAGRVFTLARAETLIGRGREATILINESGVSRRHAVVRREDDDRYVLEDLGSANGIFVNEQRVERAELVNGDRVQVGPATVLRFGLARSDEEALARRLYESSTRDALTHLYNRKYVSERLAAEIAYAGRHGTQVSVLLFDIDHFKRTNDSFGHAAGDAVLRIVAAQASKAVRTEDVVARYGGEEFLVLVRGVSPGNARVLANRLRVAIERLSIPWDAHTLKATVSVGVASLSECRESPTAEALVSLADGRLYRAKAAGRNRVC